MNRKTDKHTRYKVIDSLSGRTLLKADNLASLRLELNEEHSSRVTVFDSVEKQFFSASYLFNNEVESSFEEEFQLSLQM